MSPMRATYPSQLIFLDSITAYNNNNNN